MIKRLYRLKEKLAKTAVKGIGVDIDETLSWTVGYWFKEMSERFGNPEKRDFKELIAEYKYTFNVPYWQTSEAEAWIENQRHSNMLQKKLEVISNADEVLQKINTTVPIVGYITGRPETVEQGTQNWLDNHSFPKAPLFMRPRYISLQNNSLWRAQVLEFLYPEISYFIDDNPSLIYHLSDTYKGTIILYGDNARESTHVDVIRCVNWREVGEYFDGK